MARLNEPIVFHLEQRHVAGVLAGALLTLVLTFSLGVGFGRQLAASASIVAAPTLLAEDAKAAANAAPPVQDTGFKFYADLKSDVKTAVARTPPPVHAPVEKAAVAEQKPAPVVEAPKPSDPPSAVKSVEAAETQVEAAAAAPSPVAAKSEAPAAGAWSLQYSSVPRRAEADKFVASMKSKGVTARVVPADIPGKGRYYRIRVGAFASREEAQRQSASLEPIVKLKGQVVSAH
jgi:DedD protein